MTTNSNSPWTKTFVEVIDQRQQKLPPTWLAMNRVNTSCSECGQAVHESGRDRIAANAVIELLEQASEKVVVSSFLLADKGIEDALLATSKRGVRVYVLLASEARLGKEESEGEFDKKVLALHKEMLARLGGHVLFRSAQHFHAKVVLVDPKTRPAGILLTANLTTEALERNEELAIVLTSQEVVDATAFVRWAMWESAEHELVDPKDRFKAVKALGKVPHPSLPSALVATTAIANSIREEALWLINRARSHIVVSSFGWDVEHHVVSRLVARASEGVRVTVLARIRPSSMPALLALAKAGANVVGFKWLHAKAIWTDAQQAMVMSANLQADGLDHGFELGVRVSGSRADEVYARLTRWADGAERRLAAAPMLGETNGKVMMWQGGKFVEAEVRPSTDLALGTVTASSADELMADRPVIPNAGLLPRLAHELRCTWTVTAPILEAKAKAVLKPTDGEGTPTPYTPPVFRDTSNRIVVAVRSTEELEPARALMSEVRASAIVVAKGGDR
jgi:cardiolipin synthase